MAFPTPVINWRFNNSATNFGSGGATYNLTLSGATYSNRSINGGRSLYIDGTNDYAYVNASPLTSTSTSLTVAFWAYPTAYGWAGIGVNFGGQGTDTTSTIRFGLDNGSSLTINHPGWTSFRWSGVTGSTNSWQFYCIVYKGTWDKTTPANTAHCFKNKTKYTNTTCDSGGSTNPAPHASISIGRLHLNWEGAWHYDGSGYMDEVYVFNSQLTDAQVYDLYNYTAPKFDMQGYA